MTKYEYRMLAKIRDALFFQNNSELHLVFYFRENTVCGEKKNLKFLEYIILVGISKIRDCIIN